MVESGDTDKWWRVKIRVSGGEWRYWRVMASSKGLLKLVHFKVLPTRFLIESFKPCLCKICSNGALLCFTVYFNCISF